MRTYIVQPGDSPASIAARDDMAGCPKCSRDLLKVNPHKVAVTHPNGFKTFKELHEGEKLNLPDKWFSKEFDALPRTYFAALPHYDGVTPSTLGDYAAGVLGNYAALDTASAKTAALAQMDDQTFSNSVDDAASSIDQSVSEVAGSANQAAAGYAQDTHAGTAWARQSGLGMAAALEAGDQAAAAEARPQIQNVLTTAAGSARLALQAFYGGGAQPPPPSTFPATVTTAAQAAAAAIASDSSYCVSVAQPSSAVNSALHAFKTAWNAAQTPPVPINTGNYEQATADALARVLGTSPVACAAHAIPPLSPPPAPILPPPAFVATTSPQSTGLSTGALVGLSLLGVGAVGGAIYLATRETRVRRVYEEEAEEEQL